ncbi:MAG: hypothetical protein ACI8P3_004625 [Saprospiraceae bacterium]|jgi:hypothetical protein
MEKEKIAILMKSEGLSKDTIFYRYTYEEHLIKTEEGKYKLSANDSATEMVEDYYISGHLVMAKYVGRGLAFTLEKDNEYKSDSKVCVEIRLSEILDQGGLIYPDRSSYETSSYFLTMPEGSVSVDKSA